MHVEPSTGINWLSCHRRVQADLADDGDARIWLENLVLVGLCGVQAMMLPDYQISPLLASQVGPGLDWCCNLREKVR